ncbi:MAG: VOC family protein [Neomegalonema sp.]|nr:VOC family protein [Neomegalonema sp.]
MVPYLSFDGNCKEAFEFYSDLFDAPNPILFPFGETPDAADMPLHWHDKIAHACLMKDGKSILMGGDPPAPHYKTPQGFNVHVDLPSVAEVERVFADLSEGGSVAMPVQQTFYAKAYALVTDRFGTPWGLICMEEGGQ